MADAKNIALSAAARALLLGGVFGRQGFKLKEQPLIGFELDLELSEARTLRAEVTEHAVQDGSTITDHIHFFLAEGSLVGRVSNHSKYAPPTTPLSKDRYKTAYETLCDLYKRGELVTLYTTMGKYENVIITGVDMERDGESGLAQDFDVTFKELNIVNAITGTISTTIGAPDMTNSDNRQASPILNLGAT